MRRIWLALGVAATGCAHHRFECERDGGGPVLRVTTEHFAVTSDLPADALSREARRLENLWDSWAAFLQHEPAATGRVPVLVTRDDGVHEFSPGHDGFVVFGLEPVTVTAVREYTRLGKAEQLAANAHELVHLVSAYWLPRQPRWLAEGLASYLGDAQFVRGDQVRFGRWAWEGGTVEPLEALWGWDEAPVDGAEERAHYQSAWAWLHYLANRDEARLARLWVELRGHPTAREAFDAVFPREEQEALLARVRAYVAEGRYAGWESTVRRAPEVSAPVPVEPWEVHLLRRAVFQAVGEPAAAKAESARAQQLAPAPPPPAVELARAIDTALGPERTDVLLRLAGEPRALLELGAAPDLPAAEQLQWRERAAAALPGSARAQLLLARAAAERRDPRALAAAQRAVALAPWSVDARLFEVQALAAAARCPAARAALQLAASTSSNHASGLLRRLAQARTELAALCREPR